MIIKKDIVDKKTGKKDVSYTTNKEGWKVTVKDGKPSEERMSQEEVRNRNHGETSNKLGAVGSANNQRGITKSAIIARKELKDKKEDKLINNTQLSERLENLEKRLNFSQNPDKPREISPDDLTNLEDLKKLKNRNSFYIKDAKKQKEKLQKSFDDKMLAMLGPVTPEALKKETVKESSVLDRLEKVEKITSTIKKPSVMNTGDVIDRINKKMAKRLEEEDEETDKPEEAAADELDKEMDAGGDEPAADDTGDAPAEDAPADDSTTDSAEEPPAEGDEEEGSGLDLESDVKDETEAIQAPPNQISAIIQGGSYDLKANNVYDFYDFVADKVSDEVAKTALNNEYQKIAADKRKVTSAEQLYNAVVKRLDVTQKADADRLNAQLGGGGAGGEDAGAEGELKL